MRLPALAPDDVIALARQELGAPPGPRLTAILDKAGGNPLWVVGILDSLSEAGMLHPAEDYIETTGSELPPSLSELVVRRLAHLSPATLQLLKIIAILGDPVSLRDVAAVARRPPAEVVEVLGEAFEAQLLGEAGTKVEFRHQLVHDAIYQSMPPSVRRVLHREAAAALTAAGADRLEVADHLMLGAEPGDEEAVAWLRDASRQASATAPLVALHLIGRAEALLPRGHREADFVMAEAIQAQLRAGKMAEASARAEAVLARPHSEEVDTPVRMALAAALALQNRADEVIRLAEASLKTPSGLPAPGQVLMLAQQSWAYTYSDEPAAGEDAARRALAVAEQTQDSAMMVWALTALLVAVGRRGRFEEALAHARRAAALAAGSDDIRSLPLKPKLFLGLALFDCDLVAEARAAYREALDDEFGSGWWSSEALVADARASFVIGEWEDAVPCLLAAEQAARDKGSPLLVSQSLAYRVIIATAEGDHRLANQLAAALTDSLEGDQLSYNAGILTFAVAGLKEAEGDRRGAYEALLRCWRFEEQRGSRFYHRSLAPDLVRLALSFGERSVAAAVAEAVAAGVPMAPHVATVRSLALRCAGMVANDCELLVEAVGQSRRAPLLVEHAGACEDAARLLAQSGRRDEAATFLAEALEEYERAGAHAWVRRVRASQRELGFPPGSRGSRHRPASGWESLSATEREVSRLVAEGLTNGAVARRLYISPHTVNTHLRHVFAKLNVPNRVALAAFVHHSIK